MEKRIEIAEIECPNPFCNCTTAEYDRKYETAYCTECSFLTMFGNQDLAEILGDIE